MLYCSKCKNILIRHVSLHVNIWGVDLADMESLSKYNKGIKNFLCVIDLFSKYAWVIPLKDKKVISIVFILKSNLKRTQTKQNLGWSRW